MSPGMKYIPHCHFLLSLLCLHIQMFKILMMMYRPIRKEIKWNK